MNIFDKIKIVAQKLVGQRDVLPHQVGYQKEIGKTIELGKEPEEISESERKRRFRHMRKDIQNQSGNKELSKTTSSSVLFRSLASDIVKAQQEDIDNSAFEYLVELLKQGRKLDEAVDTVKQVFYSKEVIAKQSLKG